MTMPVLPEPLALDWGSRVAQVAHELLDIGPMGHKERPEVYRAFIAANFDDSPAHPVHDSKGTNCAIFMKGCWIQAGLFPRGKRPVVPAITTWLGVGNFSESEGFPVEKLESGEETLQPGDGLYWAGGQGAIWRTQWKGATNGHVEIVGFDGDGWMHTTYGGGGSHHRCKKSDEPKDVRLSHLRPLRWIWRPSMIAKKRGLAP